MTKEMVDIFMLAAEKWFDDTFDHEMLMEMERQGIIAQVLGFRVACLATLRAEVEDRTKTAVSVAPVGLFDNEQALDDYIADQVNRQNYDVIPKNADAVEKLCVRLYRRRKIITSIKIHRYVHGTAIIESKTAIEALVAHYDTIEMLEHRV